MSDKSSLINLVKGHRPDDQQNEPCSWSSCLLLLAALLRTYDLANLPLGFSEDEIVNIRLVDNVRQGDIFCLLSRRGWRARGCLSRFRRLCHLVRRRRRHRLPHFASVWLSLISIAIIYTLGNHLFNPIVGVLAAGLVTVNMSSILLARDSIKRCHRSLSWFLRLCSLWRVHCPSIGGRASSPPISFLSLPWARCWASAFYLHPVQPIHRARRHGLHRTLCSISGSSCFRRAAQLHRVCHTAHVDHHQHALSNFIDQSATIFAGVQRVLCAHYSDDLPRAFADGLAGDNHQGR